MTTSAGLSFCSGTLTATDWTLSFVVPSGLCAVSVMTMLPGFSGFSSATTHSPLPSTGTLASTSPLALMSTVAPGKARPAATVEPSRSTRTMSKVGMLLSSTAARALDVPSSVCWAVGAVVSLPLKKRK